MDYLKSQKFPNDPIFTQLAQLSHEVTGARIHDEYGIDAEYGDLLNDIAQLREALRKELPRNWFDSAGLLRQEAGSIATITISGYYYIVGFLTILALGGTCVPLPPGALTEEALYFLNACEANYLLTEPNTVQQAAAIKDHMENKTNQPLHTMPMPRAAAGSSPYPLMEIDDDLILAPTDPCLIVFTSGTTGRPKGVVIPRRRFFFQATMDQDSHYLAYRPVHWIGGAVPPIFKLLQGGKIHFMKRRPSPAAFWELFKKGDITSVSLAPALFKDLQDYYHAHIRYLPPEEHQRYIAGVARLQDIKCSGSTLNLVTARFWEELSNMPIRNVFGATELGGITSTQGARYVDRCIGKPFPGIIVKLSDGEQGEILVKSPWMFTHYIGDEAATKAAFDEEGFFKTGDLGRRVGDQYFFEGRATCDWIRFWHFKIPVLELEEHIMRLPYISEAYVLPVLDHESKGLAAALVRLQKPNSQEYQTQTINLQKIRDDLALTIELYKLPALLRILQDGEDVPRTASDKAMKTKMLEQYFHISDYRPHEYALDGVEFWGNRVDMNVNRQAWDWEGEA